MSNPLEYRRPTRPKYERSFVVALVVAVALLAGLMAAFGVRNPFQRRSGDDPTLRCRSNLQQLALMSIMYAKQAKSQFPDSAGTLLAETDLSAANFICDATSDVRAPGPTGPAFRQQLNSSGPPGSGGYCSYVYIGNGLTTASNPKCVVAYEPPTNHPGHGGWVAFADGSTEWYSSAKLAVMITGLNAGQNPPP